MVAQNPRELASKMSKDGHRHGRTCSMKESREMAVRLNGVSVGRMGGDLNREGG